MRNFLLKLFQFLIPDPKEIRTFILKVIIICIAFFIIIKILDADFFQVCGLVQDRFVMDRQPFEECWKIGKFRYE